MSCPKCGPGGGAGERNPNAQWTDAEIEEIRTWLARETRVGPAQLAAYAHRYGMSVWNLKAIHEGYRRAPKNSPRCEGSRTGASKGKP